jgi:hypothetical protein
MAVDQDDPILTQNMRARDDARHLLRFLMLDRAELEQRLAAAGKRDPLKWVTGRSALDNAIEETRRIIDALDELIEQDSVPIEIVPALARPRQRPALPALAAGMR